MPFGTGWRRYGEEKEGTFQVQTRRRLTPSISHPNTHLQQRQRPEGPEEREGRPQNSGASGPPVP